MPRAHHRASSDVPLSMAAHFSAAEFLCRCARPECDAIRDVSPDLLARLERLRERLGRPLVVTSGIRCAWQNQRVGGVDGSEHVLGRAADLAMPTSPERYAVIEANFTVPTLFTRLGVGGTFVHVGVSDELASKVLWVYGQRSRGERV